MIRYLAAAVILASPATIAVAQTPMTGSTYVMKAGAGDQYEIQSSRLLMQSTQNAKLKQFATMMVTDHTKSTAEVKAAAMTAGMKPAAPTLDAMGVRNMAALRAAHGTARDRLYIRQQLTAHQNALALHQGYSANGKVPQLKAAAASIVPVVQSHLDELKAM